MIAALTLIVCALVVGFRAAQIVRELHRRSFPMTVVLPAARARQQALTDAGIALVLLAIAGWTLFLDSIPEKYP